MKSYKAFHLSFYLHVCKMKSNFGVWRRQCLLHLNTLAFASCLAKVQEKHSTWFYHSLVVVLAGEDSLTHQSLEIVIFSFIIHREAKQKEINKTRLVCLQPIGTICTLLRKKEMLVCLAVLHFDLGLFFKLFTAIKLSTEALYELTLFISATVFCANQPLRLYYCCPKR